MNLAALIVKAVAGVNASNMKLTIKVKRINKALPAPSIVAKGDWIDLRAAEDVYLSSPYTVQARKDKNRKVLFDNAVVSLGIAMQLPKGFEAIVNTRSSIYKNYQVMLANNQGVIDNSYKGDKDQWFAHIVAFNDTVIEEGDRICQFRIQLSQKATVWQKIKWLLSNGVKIKVVNSLDNPNRGGHGHSGVK